MQKPSRRDFLKATGGSALGLSLFSASGCGVFGSSKGPKDRVELWYWNRSISDGLLKKAPTVVGGKLVPDKVGGDYKSQLLTTLAGRSHVPAITCMNSDVATYFPDADQFIDLRKYGADDVKKDYLPWKWQQGLTNDGKLIGFPMDTGPTALMYREDVFKKVGLPSDPDQVAALVPTWDKYIEVAEQVKKKQPNVFLIDNIGDVFTQMMAQATDLYFTRDGKFIADGPVVKKAWDTAVSVSKKGLSARSAGSTPDWNAGITNGRIAAVVGAVWMAFVMKDAGGSTSGKWRVCAAPGGAGNNGGSFMAVTKYAADPQRAFDYIKWIQSPDNQVTSYVDIDLFPSVPSAFADPKMQKPDPFFGGQRTVQEFGAAAKAVKPFYFSPWDNLVTAPIAAELLNVENVGKDPQRAWDDAFGLIRRQLKHAGVKA